LNPGESQIIPTGISVEMPIATMVGLIFPRSGLGIKHGIVLSNGTGVIDSDYRGEIRCGLLNQSRQPYKVSQGDRIAQLIFMPIYCVNILQTDELGETARGSSGFGSTGY
jgi:dUTP pyrophosphatase